jgi:hypothetical protein
MRWDSQNEILLIGLDGGIVNVMEVRKSGGYETIGHTTDT